MNDDWQDALPPYARDVISSADHDDCDEATFERMNKKILAATIAAGAAGAAGASVASASVAAEGVAGVASSAASTAASTAAVVKGGGAVALKLFGTLVVGSALVGGVAWSAMESAPAQESHHPAPDDSRGQESVVAPLGSALDSEALDSEAVDSEALDSEALDSDETEGPELQGTLETPEVHGVIPARPNERPSPGRSIGRNEREESQEVEGVSLIDELRLLRELRQAAEASPSQALVLAREHEERFSTSDLAPERDLYRIQALVRLGRLEEARAAVARFHQRFPRSAYAGRADALIQP